MSKTEPGVMVSMWDLMASWFTPTVLFCVLNLMIATIFITSNLKSHNNNRDQLKHQHGDEDHSPQLFRVPSLLERVRSFDFSLYRSEHPPYPLQPETQSTEPTANQARDVSGDAPEKVPSASEKSVVTGAEDEVHDRKGEGIETASFGEEECVNAKADDFINRFKQQLKLQRLDSLLRYKDMLKRGLI